MSKGRNLVGNTLAGFAAQAWMIALALATLPAIVRGLGMDAYAVLALVGVVTGYASILHHGLTRGAIRFFAADHARGDTVALRNHLGTALALYLALGVLAAGLTAVTGLLLIDHVLRVPQELVPTARQAFLLAALGLVWLFPFQLLTALAAAAQQLRMSSAINAAARTATLLATLVLVLRGHGLIPIVAAQIVVNALALLACGAALRRLLPGVFPPPLHLDRRFLGPLCRESSLVSAGYLLSVGALQLDRLILSALLPVGQLTYYSVSYDLASKLWYVPMNIQEAVYPAVSASHSTGDRPAVHDLYIRSTRYVMLAVLPAAALIILCAREILAAWMGPEFAAAGTGTLQLLALGVALSSAGWVAVGAAQSMGRPGIPTAVQALQLAVGATACLLLVPAHGIAGAAFAVALNHAIGIPILIAWVNRKVVGVSSALWLKQCVLSPLTLIMIPLSVAAAVRTRLDSLPLLMGGLGLAYLLDLAFSYRFVLDAMDRQVLAQQLRQIQLGRARA